MMSPRSTLAAVLLVCLCSGWVAAEGGPAMGACSDVLNKCAADAKCSKALSCYESCRVDPTGPGTSNALQCALGCNQANIGQPLYKAYVTCLKM